MTYESENRSDYECGSNWSRRDGIESVNQSGLCLIQERDALRARNAALDAALAEAVAVACKWRDHHAEKGSTERATYWNDLAVRWQDARAEANAGPAEKGGDE